MTSLLRASVVWGVVLIASTSFADDLVEAKRQFDIGARAYELADYAKAIEAYKRSYTAARKPLLLYDLGQAYRKLGDVRQGLHFYRQYLAVAPTGKYVAEAQQQVAVLTDLVAKLEAARTAPPEGVGVDAEHPASSANPADREAAKALLASASWHFSLNEYQQALEQYQDAFRLSGDSTILYNIGECQRQLGRRKDAIASYRGFLKGAPDSSKRADALALVETMESAEGARVEKPSEPSVVAVTAAPTEKRKSRAWVWGVAVGGVVVVGLAVGLGVGLTAGTHYPTVEARLHGN